MKLNRLLPVFIVLASHAGFATDRDSYPMSIDASLAGDNNIPASSSGLVSRSGNAVTVKLHLSCFGTNLRGAGNPISPNAVVTGNFSVNVAGNNYAFFVKFPGELVAKAGVKSASVKPMSADYYGGPGNHIKSAAVFNNSIVLNTDLSGQVYVDAQGKIHEPASKGIKLSSFQFDQVATCVGPAVYGNIGHSAHTATYPCGQYMGKTGILSTVFRSISVSADQSVVDMEFAFPGQTGFCGGYWSPLMLFLDESRPKFDNISPFPLNAAGKTYWPEAKSKGYFLALDKNDNQLIDQRDELFGQNDDAENGFEVLKKHDDNKDGIIDESDPTFKKMVLWNDANGNGVSEKSEMVKASSIIKNISLSYVKGEVLPIGRNAEAREFSSVQLQKKGSKAAKIVDMWFAPAEK